MSENNGELANLETGVKTWLWVIRQLKRFGLKKQLAALKEHYVRDLTESLHEGVAHSMRSFAINLISSGEAHEEHTYLSAEEFCTKARETMAKVIEIGPNQLHCCLKGFSNEDGVDQVVTWARSRPLDDRPSGLDDAHPVDGNTVWCALLGRNDRHTAWQPFNCFSSNDLASHSEHFNCTRDAWPTYYRSALVYPLRYIRKTDRRHFNVGFLAFDSPKKDAFRNIPDIFEYRNSGELRSEYHDELNKSAIFHTGAAIADTLSMVMRPFYEQHQAEEQPLLPQPNDGEGA
ncbi:MAG: hypothetical protein AB2784_05620 [Candidatus Thiodiazotropha endolucinida]